MTISCAHTKSWHSLSSMFLMLSGSSAPSFLHQLSYAPYRYLSAPSLSTQPVLTHSLELDRPISGTIHCDTTPYRHPHKLQADMSSTSLPEGCCLQKKQLVPLIWFSSSMAADS